MNIIKKINEYNNKKNIEINKKLNIKKNYNLNFDKKIKDIAILSENNKKIMAGNYVFFGIYQPVTKLWIWSSSIPGVNQKQIKLINDIKNKSVLFESDDDPDVLFIYQLLTNDVIQLTDKKYFSLINRVLNFLSDSIIILNPINSSGNIQFIGISNILESYI